MILSAAMMLEWLGRRHGGGQPQAAAALIRAAVDRAFAGGLLPPELGGSAGTGAVGEAVRQALGEPAAAPR